MKTFITATISLWLVATNCFAVQSIYCPGKHAYIKVGMAPGQVTSACGKPSFIEQSRRSATRKIPVKQLIYTVLNRGGLYPGLNPAFYDQWSLPSGTEGTSLEIDLVDDKVAAFRINGSRSNSVSICGGVGINIGDPIQKVYSACGTPESVNNTFIDQQIPSNSKPQIWTYQIDPFQPDIRLTFVNGRLESID